MRMRNPEVPNAFMTGMSRDPTVAPESLATTAASVSVLGRAEHLAGLPGRQRGGTSGRSGPAAQQSVTIFPSTRKA